MSLPLLLLLFGVAIAPLAFVLAFALSLCDGSERGRCTIVSAVSLTVDDDGDAKDDEADEEADTEDGCDGRNEAAAKARRR